jgi:hypothetical protein
VKGRQKLRDDIQRDEEIWGRCKTDKARGEEERLTARETDRGR